MSYFQLSESTEHSPSRRSKPSQDDENTQPESNRPTAFIMNLLTLPLRPLRPLLPYMFPLLVCLLCIPLLMFFSGAAGWVVWRNVPVGWRVDAFLQYGDTVNPFAVVQLPPILADQPYDISLHLVLPATESNYALGNFMATLRLATAYNESIATIRRPAALVPPRPSLIKQALLGSPATAKLDIQLLSHFVSGTSTVNARLELGRSDGWKSIGNGQGRELSVLEATLKGTVRPRGILAILARYPRLTTFASTFTFFFVSLLVACGFLFTAIRSDSSPQHPPFFNGKGGSDSEDGNDSPGPHLGEKRYSRRQIRDRDGGSSSSSLGDEKNGPEDTPSHSGTGVPVSVLRKRRSSPAIENVDTGVRRSQVKIEVDDLLARHSTTPPPYPKSPYPRPASTSSNSSSRRESAVTDPVSPSGADVES